MKFSAPTNWLPELLDFYASLPQPVTEVFGSLQNATVGSGRAMFTLPKVDADQAQRHIEYAHKKGMAFNFILNAPCLGNMEYDPGTHRQMIGQLAWIDSTGADSVTVTIPYLIRIIRERFPRLRIKASVIAHVNSIQMAKAYENLGADEINIDYMCNRDFAALAAIKKAVAVDLSLLVNDICLYHCPYRLYHYNLVGHSTQEGHALKGAYYDFCMISCTIEKYTHPEQLIRARWIRPEDLAFYERLGFDRFKLSGRNMSFNWLQRMATAYTSQRYHGNLADILSGTGFDPDGTVHYTIDNAALNGFLDHFTKNNCSAVCGACTYCKEVSERIVTFTPKKARAFVHSCRLLLEGLTSGMVFEQTDRNTITSTDK